MDTRVAADPAVLSAHKVEVQPRSGNTKERRIYRLWGFGPEVLFRVHNNTPINLLRGLVERVYRVEGEKGLEPPPRPPKGAFSGLRVFANLLHRCLPKAAPVDLDTFVEYYRGRQRTVYQRAVDSLKLRPVSREDARLKAFVKAEKINVSKKPDPAPRLIQPRDPRYNAAVGRFLRPLEKPVFKAIAEVWGGPTVLKVNAADQAMELRRMWDMFPNPVAVGLDASRFDQHVSSEALRWEHSVYTRCFSGSDRAELEKLLSWQLHNEGRAFLQECRVKYKVEGSRMSGDMNTSLGNCLIMCGLVWQYVRERGIVARLGNNGDDCVVIMDRSSLELFMSGLEDWFRHFGFTMKVETPVFKFEHIEFCQTHPVWTPEGWLMVRDPRIAIAKDLVTLLPMETSFGAFLGAVGECGLAATGGLPVYQEFYRSMLLAGKPSRAAVMPHMLGGLRFLSMGMKRVYGDVHPMTRASFWEAFGMLPDEQENLEAWLRAHPITYTKPQTLTRFVNIWYK